MKTLVALTVLASIVGAAAGWFTWGRWDAAAAGAILTAIYWAPTLFLIPH